MALVITIVILIILATISIGAVFGDNGLIKRTQDAKNYQANAEIEEGKFINDATDFIDGIIPFEPEPTPEPPTGGEEMEDMTNGVIEIKWLSGTSNNVSNTPNAPVTKSISNGTMELVEFDESSKTWIPGSEYSYEAGSGSNDNNSSKWANARVTINGVESYFVWIPRYAYRIIYFDSAESKKAYQEGTLTEKDAVVQGKIIGYSDSRGIVDKNGKKIDSIASTTKTMVSKDYFMVHPAFMDGSSTGFQNGEWNSELPGIWIGKYETSTVEESDIFDNDLKSKTPKVQPGAYSITNKKIGDMYTYSKAYQTELKSHMLKNSEWGAVAYLTESKYGRNGTEIEKNIIETTVIEPTGGGKGTAYFDTNQLQSSTGNVYGIYDLIGCKNERMAAYYKDGGSNISYGSSFANGISDEYSTAYDGTDVMTAYKYGDATLETKNWHLDGDYFVNSNLPFFNRGHRHE